MNRTAEPHLSIASRWVPGREPGTVTGPPLRKFGIAAAVVLLAVALQELLAPVLSDDGSPLLFIFAVAIAAWSGGSGPGALAVLLAEGAYAYTLMAAETATGDPGFDLALLGLESVGTLVLITALKHSRRQTVVGAVLLRDSELERQRAEEALSILAGSGAVLVSSLDYRTTLAALADQLVPGLADWCLIDVVEDGQIRPVALATSDPHRRARGWAIRRKLSFDHNAGRGIPRVIRSGAPELVQEVRDDMLERVAIDPDTRRTLRSFGVKAWLIVPLTARGRTLGSITFALDKADRFFGATEIDLAQEIARRAAVAIDNARLYQDVVTAEQQLRRFNEELERRIFERTAQLQEANQDLESFSYSVSHDLRSPIRHIAGFCELLARRTEGKIDDVSERYVHNIGEAAHQAGNMIDALLAFSRTGRTGMKRVQVNMGELVRLVQKEVEPDAEGRRIIWKLGSLPEVEGDPTMLRLVLRNLLSNAVKYTRPREEAVIEVGATRTDEEEIIYVKDNGVGFDMRYQDRLFGVFQRLHSAEEFEGTGIGLANVRRIIQRHGGRTWAESEVGSGAVFYISFPRHAASSHAQNEAAGMFPDQGAGRQP